MKLGFYYHIPLTHQNCSYNVPSFLGVFIDSLAQEVDELRLFMHEANASEQKNCNYAIQSTNVVWINLGLKTPAWHRSLYYRRFMRLVEQGSNALDALLVRAPSPLAPYFLSLKKKTAIGYFVVGDYSESVAQGTGKGWRARIIDVFLKQNQERLERAVIQADFVLVNSASLLEKYSKTVDKISLVKTTTLKKHDIIERVDSFEAGMEQPVRLLFTGRINWQKGLRELLQAMIELRDSEHKLVLDIVGWEENDNKPIEKEILKMAEEGGIGGRVVFHGKKSVGPELNKFYRQAMIYVLPTYHEGFPRTIWEAMANSTPVITTPVGSIPHFLKDGEDCLMVPVRNVPRLKDAIQRLCEDENLRRKLVARGLEHAKSNTLEVQAAKAIQIIKSATA